MFQISLIVLYDYSLYGCIHRHTNMCLLLFIFIYLIFFKRYYRRKKYFAFNFNFNFNLFFKIYDVCRNEKISNQLYLVIHTY